MRRLAFAALLAALAIAALLVGPGDKDDGAPPTRTRSIFPRPARAVPTPPRRSPALHRSARRFLAAFLDYEAGDRGQAVRAALRRTASARFSHESFAAPAPHQARRRVPSPPTTTFHIIRLPHQPELAIVTGTAHRATGPEPFAFLFALRRGRWLAIAPAE